MRFNAIRGGASYFFLRSYRIGQSAHLRAIMSYQEKRTSSCYHVVSDEALTSCDMALSGGELSWPEVPYFAETKLSRHCNIHRFVIFIVTHLKPFVKKSPFKNSKTNHTNHIFSILVVRRRAQTSSSVASIGRASFNTVFFIEFLNWIDSFSCTRCEDGYQDVASLCEANPSRNFNNEQNWIIRRKQVLRAKPYHWTKLFSSQETAPLWMMVFYARNLIIGRKRLLLEKPRYRTMGKLLTKTYISWRNVRFRFWLRFNCDFVRSLILGGTQHFSRSVHFGRKETVRLPLRPSCWGTPKLWRIGETLDCTRFGVIGLSGSLRAVKFHRAKRLTSCDCAP